MLEASKSSWNTAKIHFYCNLKVLVYWWHVLSVIFLLLPPETWHLYSATLRFSKIFHKAPIFRLKMLLILPYVCVRVAFYYIEGWKNVDVYLSDTRWHWEVWKSLDFFNDECVFNPFLSVFLSVSLHQVHISVGVVQRQRQRARQGQRERPRQEVRHISPQQMHPFYEAKT